MSGFFMVRRELFQSTAKSLKPDGFKILLDFLLNCRKNLKIKDIPFTFRSRNSGRSKLDVQVIIHFLEILFLHFSKRF